MLKMLSCSIPWRDCPTEVPSIPYEIQKMERKRIILENFNQVERKKMSGISDCFHGFHNGKSSQARSGAPKKRGHKMLVKMWPEKDRKFTLLWEIRTRFALQKLRRMISNILRR
ncbi:MAG: hypothetical protein LBG04_03635 [Holosporaceae bacterium]|jgi:hypothetical protein|nr:hypothetical protein [Holosporaceae bacterium]